MRFREEDYLKAFPRENKKPVKVEVVGNVLEGAAPEHKDPAHKEPEPAGVLEGSKPDPDIPADPEGSDDGGDV